MARNTTPRDLVPYNGGTLVVIGINADGTEGEIQRTFSNFMTEFTPTISRTDGTVESGEGADYTIPESEEIGIAITMSAYDPSFHALVGGQEIVYGTAVTPSTLAITATSAGYDFGDIEPVARDGSSTPEFIVTDSKGHGLTAATSATTAEGEYYYDSTENTITFYSDYIGEGINIIYWSEEDDVITMSSPELLRVAQFKLMWIGEVQSVQNKTKIKRNVVVDRAIISGDLPSIAGQKSVSTSITYNFASQTPSVGNRSIVEQFVVID